jgi:uncharacterized membrane protein YgdD (TMEM256/DUF423 family)
MFIVNHNKSFFLHVSIMLYFSNSLTWKVGCTFGAAGVILGAFGAHGLQHLGEVKMKNWATATQYLFIHSLAMLAVSSRGVQSLAPFLFTMGSIGFSGSIYCLTLLENRSIRKVLGPITPLGGLCFIGGWIAAFWI